MSNQVQGPSSIYDVDGVLIAAGANIPSGAAAGRALVSDAAGRVSWTPIGTPVKSGWWYPADGGGGNRTMTFNLLWLWPFDMQRANTLAQLAVNVTTQGSAGTTIRVGVYSSDGAGYIGNLLVDAGAVAGDSTGIKTVTGLAAATNPDRLWFGAVWQGTNSVAPVLQAYARAAPYVGATAFTQFPSLIAYQFNGISGALPATLGAYSSTENSNAPAVQFTVQ